MVNQFLFGQCSCLDALSFFFNLNELETSLYFVLIQQQQEKTVAELCEITSRHQSTVYTALEKLISHGVIFKNKRSGKNRGYEFVYTALSTVEVAKILKNKLELLYREINSCLSNFDKEAMTCEIKF